MVNVPSVPEIITVNSETLQTQIRDLLPSQNGFGSELQATNVITPIIDLTAAAEGSGLPVDLSRAVAFGSQTAFNISNATTTIANSPGFYRVFGTASSRGSGNQSVTWQLNDGSTTKDIWALISDDHIVLEYDYIVWLAVGESIIGTSSASTTFLKGSVRQVADSTGTLVNPSGYPL
jgi:hypothetical protein